MTDVDIPISDDASISIGQCIAIGSDGRACAWVTPEDPIAIATEDIPKGATIEIDIASGLARIKR